MEPLCLSKSKFRIRFQNKLASRKGFAAILLLTLLPLVLTLLVVLVVVHAQIEMEMALKATCRENLLFTQHQVSVDLKTLLNLNPTALALKAEERILILSIATASAAQNWALVTKLTGQLQKVKQARIQLDRLQKSLITKMNMTLMGGSYSARSKLNRIFDEYRGKSQELTTHSSFFSLPRSPLTIAVEPKDQGIAPIYQPKKRFEWEQHLSLSWTYNSKTLDRFSTWLKLDKRFVGTCAATLNSEDKKWNANLIEAPSLLRL